MNLQNDKSEQEKITTLDDYANWLKQFQTEQLKGDYVFRGLARSDYKLESSAYRRLKLELELDEGDFVFQKLLEYNKNLLQDARFAGHGVQDGREIPDLELLAELQHYGAATCFIDFTYNAYVALWFACKDEGDEDDGKVVVTQIKTDKFRKVKSLKQELSAFFQNKSQNIGEYSLPPQRDNKPISYHWTPPVMQNNRILAQNSVFIFGAGSISIISTCIIEKESKSELRRKLKSIMGLTENSIFPDFAGFARSNAHDAHYAHDLLHYFARARRSYMSGQLDNAIEQYTQVINLNPDHAEAYYNRGCAYADKGKYDKAIEDCTRAIELDPNVAGYYNTRGNCYNYQGKYDMAIEDYSKAIEFQPNFAPAYGSRGNAHLAKGKYDKAIEDCTRAIELDPNVAWYYNTRGNCYQGKYDKAIEDFSKVIELQPNFAPAYGSRGNVYLFTGERGKAIEDFSKQIKLRPHDAMAYFNRGNAYLITRKLEESIADYTRAIELRPNFASAYSSRGNAHFVKGERGKAIEDYSKAIELDPNVAWYYNARGNCYNYQGKYDMAIEDYSREIELRPNLASAYSSRGNVHFVKGKYDKAIEDFTMAIELDHTLTNIYYNRGTAYLILQQWSEARADLHTTKEKNINFSKEFHDNFGSITAFEKQYDVTLPADIKKLLEE